MRLRGRLGRRALAASGLACASALIALCLPASSPASTRNGTQATAFPAKPHALPLRVPNAQAYAAAKAAAERRYRALLAHHQQPQAPTTTQRSSPNPLASPTPVPLTAVFGGLNEVGIAGGGTYTQFTPPDSTGAIGPNYYIEMVNAQIVVYSRTSLSLVETEGEEAFTERANACGDGQIRWDQQAKRWEYALLECTASHTEEGVAFGWSKTEDPTTLNSGWCKYHKETGTILEDYPKLGGDDDFLLIGVNGFKETSKGEAFVGSGVFAIPKPAPGEATCPSPAVLVPTIHELKMPSGTFTPVPANIFGNSTTGYVVASEYPNPEEGKGLKLFAITKSLLGEPILNPSTTIVVRSYFFPPNVPQPGTADELDSSDTRLTQAVAAIDPSLSAMAVWTQHTVAAAGGGPAIVRWYELNTVASSLAQEGSVEASAGNFAFNGAISPTTEGGAVIDYNVGGSEMLVQLRAQSRLSSTPAGKMAAGLQLAESHAIDKDSSCPSVTHEPEMPCRWGDYAGASPDPSNSAVVWGSGQFNGQSLWRTENFALATTDAPPTASFNWSPSSPTAASPVSFDGSSSDDPDGEVTAYEWSFGDGSTGTSKTTSHTYMKAGTYPVTLTVTDNAGLKTTSEPQYVVVADAPPTASFAVTTSTLTAASPVAFDGSTSHDPDGSIASYEWSFGDGSALAGGVSLSHTYAHAGKYVVRLTVTDDGGLSASIEHEVTVADAAPTASFSISNTATSTTVPAAKGAPSSSFAVATPSPTAGLPVGFDGSGSRDPDGVVTGYSWSFGDGTAGSGATPSHVYTKAGSYTVRLTVTDNGGLSASTEQTIAVGPEPNVFAVVAVKPNKKNGSVAVSVRVPGPGVLKAVDAASVRRAKATSKATLLTRLTRILGFADPSAEAAKKARPKHKPKRKPALVKPVRLTVAGAGTVTIQMVLTSAGKAELIRHRNKLTVKLLLMFAPTYGSPASKPQVIRPAIVKPKGKKKRK